MSSKSGLERSLRRLKPEKHRHSLAYRDRAALPFLATVAPPLPPLLLDTTVYIDALQDTLPADAALALRAGTLWHSTVTEAELAFAAGRLEPKRDDSGHAVTRIAASLEMRPAHRILAPDREVWREAGILAGLLARLQGYGKNEQRQALHDALIYLGAAKHGCAVLTRNTRDFDLLLQLAPWGRAIFYDRP